jgi:1-acyl-sn-glycerol-3-phosphate acyltransferase
MPPMAPDMGAERLICKHRCGKFASAGFDPLCGTLRRFPRPAKDAYSRIMWTDALSPLRWLLRGSAFLLHGTVGVVAAVLAQGRLGHAIKFGDRSLALILMNWWSGLTCRLFGLKPTVYGKPEDGPVLIVANHLSWADIQALHSVAAMSFIAKAEISRWPVMRNIANAGGTIYHQRGSHDSQHGALAQAMNRLAAGGRVAIFPEGGIFGGTEVKRFHARMFRLAQDSGCPVQPVMIRYVRDGARDPEITFLPGESFLQNLIRFMGRPACRAEVAFLEPYPPADLPRKALASRAEAAVRAAYDSPAGSPPAWLGEVTT